MAALKRLAATLTADLELLTDAALIALLMLSLAGLALEVWK